MPISLCLFRPVRSGVVVCLLSFLFSAGPGSSVSFAAEADWYDGRWPQQRHAVSPHPQAVFGQLDNGLRTVFLPHARPAGGLHLSLLVQVGSLMEEPQERGIAHYLEHMAFNGSRRFPPGTLIPFLQQHGLRFGADANAHTSTAETVYELTLNRADPQTLEAALQVLRDIAGDLTLAETEVAREQGVILAERAARDTEKSRLGRERRALMFPGTRFAEEVIGVPETISAIRASDLRRFYDGWYRPERMVLVAVGDLASEDLRQSIHRHFSDLTARGPAAVSGAWGDIRHAGIQARHDRTETAGLSVSASALSPRQRRPDSPAEHRRQLAQAIAAEMMNRRLDARRQATGVFAGARASATLAFELFPTASLSATCTVGRETDCVSALGQELGSALKGGFSDAEFAAAVAFQRTRLDSLLRRAESRTSTDLAGEIVATLTADQVFQSEAQTREALLPLLEQISRAEAEALFRDGWATGNRMITSAGAVDLGPDPSATLTALWEEAERAAPTVSAPAVSAARFPYLPEPDRAVPVRVDLRRVLPVPSGPGEPVLTERRVVLDTGLTLRLLPTPFTPGQMSLTLLFGSGLDALSDADYTVARTTASVLRGSVGALDREATRRLLGARQIQVEESYDSSAFSISASAPRRDQDLAVTALWTQFTDPRPQPEEHQRFLDSLRRDRADRETLDRVVTRLTRQALYGADRRTAELEEQDAAGITPQAMADFLTRSRQSGPQTLIAVGDFDEQALLTQVARLFSALPPPAAAGIVLPARPVFPAGQSFRQEARGPAGAAVLTLAWQADMLDEADPSAPVARRLAAALLKERLRERIREDMGASYAPAAAYRHDPLRGGYGFYTVTVKTGQDHLDRVRQAAREGAAALAIAVPEALLEQVRAAAITGGQAARRQNRYWHSLLVQESTRGLPVADWAARQAEALRDIGPAAVQGAAAALRVPPVDMQVTETPGEEIAR